MEFSKYIDHTLLKPQVTEEQILKLIEEAKIYKFASVCVNPSWVKLAHKKLNCLDVKVCTVIGFPLGATTTETKVFETQQAIEQGAEEVDMVINIGALKAKKYDYVKNDIQLVVEAAKGKALVKVIIETCLLTNDEKIKVCKLAKDAGADYVKTSTGFSTGGAKVEDIKLMRETVGDEMGVKASGGIHTKQEMLQMIANGASRIGASCGVELIK